MRPLETCHRSRSSARCAATAARCATIDSIRLDLRLLAITALAAVSTGCGAGTFAAVFGLNNSDESSAEQITVLYDDSEPALSLAMLPEPAMQRRLVAGEPLFTFVADPTELLAITLSKDADDASAMDPANTRVSVRRPVARIPGGPPPPEIWDPVTVLDVRLRGTRILEISLAGRTQLDGLYRVILSGIRDAELATTLATSTSYFVTRVGSWSVEPEVLTFGDGSFATPIALTSNRNAYTTIEALYSTAPQPPFEYTWTASLATAPFGAPWQAPELVWRSPSSQNARDFEMNTGGIRFTESLGFFLFQEGNPSVTPIQDVDVRLKVPVADLTTAGTIDFEFVDGVAGGDPDAGVIDQGGPNAPELAFNHISYRARLIGEGQRLLATWWSFTDPVGAAYQRRGAYANDLDALSGIGWSDQEWGPSTLLSTGTARASWPFLAPVSDGSAVAIWWTANNDTNLLSPNIGAQGEYQLATYPAVGTPNPVWSAATTLATGPLPAITDVHPLTGGRVLILTTGLPPAPGSSGPEARILDLATSTLSAPSRPNGTFVMFMEYQPTDPLNNNLGDWRRKIYASTPLATPFGVDRFVVRWAAGNTGSELKLATYDASSDSWGDVEDFSSFAPEPQIGRPSLTIDNLGWASLLWVARAPMPLSMTETYVNVRRANIVTDGLQGLSGSIVTSTQTNRQLNDRLPGTFGTFPALSNPHPTGATAASWNFGIGTVSGNNLLGTLVSRYE